MTATTAEPAIDPGLLRDAFGLVPSGVAALAAVVEGEAHVVVASSFTVGVSLDPPLVAVFVQRSSGTWPALARAGRIGISVLGADQGGLARQMAGRDRAARLAGVERVATGEGAIRLAAAAVWFDCSLHAVHPAGDHDAVLLRIHDLAAVRDRDPLVFHRSRFTRLA